MVRACVRKRINIICMRASKFEYVSNFYLHILKSVASLYACTLILSSTCSLVCVLKSVILRLFGMNLTPGSLII